MLARRLVYLSGLLLAICFAGGVIARASRDRQPSATAPAVLAVLNFRDQTGATRSGATLGAELLLVHFMFTRCGSVCPTQTRELARLVSELPADVRADVRLLSISLDPEHDGPSELAAFARAHGAERPMWTFAASTREETQQLLARLRRDEAVQTLEQRADHGTDLYLFDRHGRLVQRFGGSPLDRARLGRDLVSLRRSQASSS